MKTRRFGHWVLFPQPRRYFDRTDPQLLADKEWLTAIGATYKPVAPTNKRPADGRTDGIVLYAQARNLLK